MKKNDFTDQYKDPRWQKKRLQIMERDEFMCISCQETEKTLNVHHLEYIKDKFIWDYPNSELITLCEDCHKEITEIINFIISEIKHMVVCPDSFWEFANIYKEIRKLKYPPDLNQACDLLRALNKFKK
jgi:hypothetical protein